MQAGQRMDGFGLMDYNARYYDPLIGRFISPDTLIPQPGNPLAWDRYAYTYSNPIRNVDPSGHKACEWDENGNCERDPDWDPVLEIDATADPSLRVITDQEKVLPFDSSLGGNLDLHGYDQGNQEGPSYDGPSIATLIAIGIPLTVAIVLVEAGLTFAEIQIGLATIVQPELIPVTIPLELLLTGTSLALIDIEVAYWSYTYRVAFTPEDEPVNFEALPPWGLSEEEK